ncbi:MAG: IclR family transcriptional regulator [Rhizobiales bacterium]|nr:IclR family transcriptional regulator [Hyphomicrobiales bacterium]NRB12905.1 IclR family transcriptional regulator [Hyphomicrobiales bacterium]
MRLLQSLTRGLAALDYLKEKAEPVRLTDVAATLGVEKSNASHILKTLVASGYASQDSSRRYLIHKDVTATDDSHSLEEIIACKQQWKPVLEKLMMETGECSHMAVLVKSQVWYIDKVDSNLPLKVDHPIGSLSPLHCTALGKIFLAYGDAVPNQKFDKYTATTISSNAELMQEIEKTRIRGYAVDNEEFSPGIRCVAHPIFDKVGKVIAAFGVSGPTVRLDDQKFLELGELVKTVYAQKMKEINNED